ncbi:hypothetical protein Leryth_005501 [Lithospermum erythrorhizon]|nr:hypothetical protein Leryth_005501 [Lithospermum erythrorhizon]
MPSSIKKNLNFCFTKIKQPSSPQLPLQQDPNHPLSNSTSPSILIKNFNSLYETNFNSFQHSSTTTSTISHDNDAMDYETYTTRFIRSTSSSSDNLVGGSIAIPTYSPDPYADFRRSMQEMVETHGNIDVRANWDYLHELLMCYLSLNPKSNHKFIVGAFADLIKSELWLLYALLSEA